MVVGGLTEIEKVLHRFWMPRGSRILEGERGCRRVERRLHQLFLLRYEDNRRLRRPIKGTPRMRSGRAVRALDWPSRRLGDGYKEMG